MTNISAFVHNGISIEADGDFISLNRLWEMAGVPKNQNPHEWTRLPQTIKLISQVLTEQGFQDNTGFSRIIKTKRGKGGGTLAHWKLALDYAGYLSPALKSQFYDWIRERVEEESNPDLAYKRGRERAIKQWQKQGRSQEWIQERIDGTENRLQFTDTLKKHGVSKSYEYAACTNEIYKPLLGGTAKEIKQHRSITKLRDGLSRVELMAVGLAEAIASETMETQNAKDFGRCQDICTDSGARVSRVFK
jgi:phage anti-repressor protein